MLSCWGRSSKRHDHGSPGNWTPALRCSPHPCNVGSIAFPTPRGAPNTWSGDNDMMLKMPAQYT